MVTMSQTATGSPEAADPRRIESSPQVRPTARVMMTSSKQDVPFYPLLNQAKRGSASTSRSGGDISLSPDKSREAASMSLQLASLRGRSYQNSLESLDDEGLYENDIFEGQQKATDARRHSGRLVSLIDKLKPGKQHTKAGKAGEAREAFRPAESKSATRSPIKAASRIASDKHTPLIEEARGDFDEFLKAAELQERLEQEQLKEAKAELKAAKLKRKKGGRPFDRLHALKSKKCSTSEELSPPLQRLEDRKEFPGAFPQDNDDSEVNDGRSNATAKLATRSAWHQKPPESSSGLRRRPTNSRPSSSKTSYLGICGQVLSSEDEDEDGGNSKHHDAQSLEIEDQRQVLLDTRVDSTTLVIDGLEERKTETAPSFSHSEAIQLFRSSSSSSLSSTGSLADHHVAETMVNLRLQQYRGKSASTRSLKSWRSSDSPGGQSFASGGANHKLSVPLLELEELELKSFLRNFNRHTREVRVPASVHFPRRRMPRWEDFRVPADEATIAARKGKRVTVLTHVDRGLQALARQEGEGVPPVCQPSKISGKDKEKSKGEKKATQRKKGLKDASSSGVDDDDELECVPSQPTVHQPPEPGLFTYGLSTGLPTAETDEEFRSFGNSISARMLPEKNQRAAKQSEKSKHLPPANQQASLGGKGLILPNPDEMGGAAGGSVNIYEAHTEMRPRPDDIGMTEDSWEVIDHQREVQVSFDPHESERVDAVAFCIAYILALVERYAPEELDNTTDQTYREGKARSHLERLYLIAPFWERLGFGIRRLYRWNDPRRTATAAMIYFILWWTDLLPTAFFLLFMFYILQFRFFPPEASYLHEQVRARMARGVEADRLAERLRRRSRLDIFEIYRRFTVKYGSAVQLAAGDIADFHEKVKNLILWRNPPATWRTFTFFAVITVLVTFLPAYYILKAGFFFLGFTFFFLLPLQSHYPRYRRPLSPIWWALWGSPTDAQFAIQLLRRRQLEKAISKIGNGRDQGGGGESGGKKHSSKFRRSEAAHAVKGGAMRPMDEKEWMLWGLEEEVEVKGGESGEKRFKPKKLGSFFCQHRGVPG